MHVTSSYYRQRHRWMRPVSGSAEVWSASAFAAETAEPKTLRPLCPSEQTLERLARYHKELKHTFRQS